MAVKTIGRVLKERRTQLGLGLSEVEQLTKIQKLYIVALEADDYKVLPGEFYIKAYLKQYAEKLGLNPEELLNAYDLGKGISVEENENDIQETYHFVKPSDRIPPEEESKKTWQHYIPVISLSIVAIAIVLAVGLAVFLNKPGTPDLLGTDYHLSTTSSSQGSTMSSSETSTSSSSTTSSSSSSSSLSTEKLEVTGSGAAINVKLVNAKTPVKLVFKAETGGDAWVYASNTEMEKTGLTVNALNSPTVNATLTEGATQSVITLGNHEKLSLTINGKAVNLTALSSVSGPYTINLTVEKAQ